MGEEAPRRRPGRPKRQIPERDPPPFRIGLILQATNEATAWLRLPPGTEWLGDGEPIEGFQCRIARDLLMFTQDDLAEASGVGKRSIAKLETGPRERVTADVISSIRKALEAEGIQFFAGSAGAGALIHEHRQRPRRARRAPAASGE